MKKMTVSLMVMVLFAAMTCFTGCAGDDQDSTSSGYAAVCYAIAPTANSQGLNLNSPVVQDMMYDTILGQGYVSVVIVDGKPEMVSAASYELPDQYKGASKEKLKTDARANTANLISFMTNEVANDDQVDYLEGLRIAVRSLHSLEGYDSKTIVMIGTGLSTQGDLDFRNNLLSAEPQAVLDALEEKNEIPDLSGMTVVWQQMGDVAAPQQALSQTQKIRLQEIWGGIVERGGGTFVYNDFMAAPVNTETSFPEVDVVELPQETPVKFDAEMLETSTEEALLDEPVMFTEEQVTFVPDQAEYLDETAAMETIRPIAEYLTRNRQINVLLVGTTAGDENDDFSMTLSRARADAVMNSLTSLGVEASRITTIGLGSGDPWHISGVGFDGPEASSNRKVVLMDASSEAAINIISGQDS